MWRIRGPAADTAAAPTREGQVCQLVVSPLCGRGLARFGDFPRDRGLNRVLLDALVGLLLLFLVLGRGDLHIVLAQRGQGARLVFPTGHQVVQAADARQLEAVWARSSFALLDVTVAVAEDNFLARLVQL